MTGTSPVRPAPAPVRAKARALAWRPTPYAVAGTGFWLLLAVVAWHTPIASDFGQHASAVQRVRDDPWHPSNPLLKTSGAGSPYYSPYIVTLGLAARATGAAGWEVVRWCGPLNLAVLVAGVGAYARTLSRRRMAPVYALLAFTLLWGVRGKEWSGFCGVWSLTRGASYPSAFAVGLTFLLWTWTDRLARRPPRPPGTPGTYEGAGPPHGGGRVASYGGPGAAYDGTGTTDGEPGTDGGTGTHAGSGAADDGTGAADGEPGTDGGTGTHAGSGAADDGTGAADGEPGTDGGTSTHAGSGAAYDGAAAAAGPGANGRLRSGGGEAPYTGAGAAYDGAGAAAGPGSTNTRLDTDGGGSWHAGSGAGPAGPGAARGLGGVRALGPYAGLGAAAGVLLLIHPITALAAAVGIAATVAGRQRGWTRAVAGRWAVTAVAAAAVALAWPYFDVFALAGDTTVDAVHRRLYTHPWQWYGLALAGLPALAWRARRRLRDPLVLMFAADAVVVAYGWLSGHYTYGRVFALLLVPPQFALAVELAAAPPWTRLRSVLAPLAAVALCCGLVAQIGSVVPQRWLPVATRHPQRWPDYRWVADRVPVGSVVLTDGGRAMHVLPAYGLFLVDPTWPDPSTPAAERLRRRKDSTTYFSPGTPPATRAAILHRYDVTWLLLEAGQRAPARTTLTASSPATGERLFHVLR